MLLSVIIPTYNRENLLAKCIDSVLAQEASPERWEIIVVNNNSSDGTERLVLKYTQQYPNVCYAYERKQGDSNARNRGIQEARGEYFLFLDDDAFLPRGYLAQMLNTLERLRPDIVGGPIYPYYTDGKPWWFRDEYEIRKYADASGFSSRCRVSGGNFVVRRDVLVDLGGMFQPTLGAIGTKMNFGNDAQLLEAYRAGRSVDKQRVYYCVECYVLHYVPTERMRLSYVLRRSYHLGRSAWQVKSIAGEVALTQVLKSVLRGFLGTPIFVTRELYHRGIRHADYVGMLRRYFHLAGMFLEGLKISIRK